MRLIDAMIVGVIWPTVLPGQGCPSGIPADAIPNAGFPPSAAVWPWQFDDIVAAVPLAITTAGLKIAVGDADGSYFRTTIHYGWPDDEALDEYRHLDPPGVIVTVSVTPAGDSATVLVEGRSICATASTDSLEFHASPEDALEFFYAERVMIGLLDVLRSRGYADQQAKLASCPALHRGRVHQQGVRGSVLLEFIVDTTGAVEPESIRVIGRAEPALSKAATQRPRHCRFLPAVKDGKPVRALVRMPIRAIAR